MSDQPLLRIDDLTVGFRGPRRTTKTVLKGVSLDIGSGETVGLVGESGSGKTTIGRAILGLAPITGGSIHFRGRDITHATRRERRELARDIQVVFQDPYSSLNPSLRIADILAEPLRAAGVSDGGQSRIRDLLARVGLPADAGRRYPREFSGGQRQRIAVARALALEPALIICDEPTSALDLTTQARVLALLQEIKDRTGVAYLFISHDLGVVRETSDRIAVLRDGEIVELGAAEQVSLRPNHPYSKRLHLATPVPDPRLQAIRRERRRALIEQEESAGGDA